MGGEATISAEDFAERNMDECIQAYFAGLELDTPDSDSLFKLMDNDNDGWISQDEFVEGCLQLKGVAHSLDVALLNHAASHLQQESREVQRLLTAVCEAILESGSRHASVAGLAPVRNVTSLRECAQGGLLDLPRGCANINLGFLGAAGDAEAVSDGSHDTMITSASTSPGSAFVI
eukprot:NODE_3573_length_768_cov_8.959327.p2 GENE.NODE_3573_length_768_cov_8.959327~~NODE_3573_length_768_cov_8.959327.p2  ORF type:complete len:176 (+),score=55.15 NODE_3573_length_768_cov_8.959327:3-530(+)